MKNPASMEALVGEVRAKRARLLERLRFLGSKPFEAQTSYGFVFASRDPREAGKPWRLTFFGHDKKPMGHMTYASFEALAKDLGAYGVHDADQIKTESWSLNPAAKKRWDWIDMGMSNLRGFIRDRQSVPPASRERALEYLASIESGLRSGKLVTRGFEYDAVQVIDLMERALDEYARDYVHNHLVAIGNKAYNRHILNVAPYIPTRPMVQIEREQARAERAKVAEEAKKKSAAEALAELKAERALRAMTSKRATTEKAAAKARAKGLEIAELGPIVSEVGKGLRAEAEARARGFEIGEGGEGRPHGFDIIDWEGGLEKAEALDLRDPSPIRSSEAVKDEARSALQSIAPSIAWKFDKDPSATSLYEISNTLRLQRDPGRELHRLADRLTRLARELDEANRGPLSERDQLALEAARGARAIDTGRPDEMRREPLWPAHVEREQAEFDARQEIAKRAALIEHNPRRNPSEDSLYDATELVRKLTEKGVVAQVEKRFRVKLLPEKVIQCGGSACVWQSGQSVVKITRDYADAQAALAIRELQRMKLLPPEIDHHLALVHEVCEITGGAGDVNRWVIVVEYLDPPTEEEAKALRYFFQHKDDWIFAGKIYAHDAATAASVKKLSRIEPAEAAMDCWRALLALQKDFQIRLYHDAHAGNWGRGRDGFLKLFDFGQSGMPLSLTHIPAPCRWDETPTWRNPSLLGEPVQTNPLDPICLKVGEAYLATPDESKSERAKRLYAQYARETERLFKLIRLRVEFTTEDPYKTAAEMREDAIKHGRMKVFSGGTPHDLLTQEQNLRGRAVHDLLAHLVCGCPFTASGEYNAFEAQAALYSHELRSLLFTEIVGQSCAYVLQKGTHAEQKVLFLPDHLIDAAQSMRRRFKDGLGLAGVISRGWIDPQVLAIAESTGYALRYLYAVLENKPMPSREAALMTNPGWSKQAVKLEAPAWARWL